MTGPSIIVGGIEIPFSDPSFSGGRCGACSIRAPPYSHRHHWDAEPQTQRSSSLGSVRFITGVWRPHIWVARRAGGAGATGRSCGWRPPRSGYRLSFVRCCGARWREPRDRDCDRLYGSSVRSWSHYTLIRQRARDESLCLVRWRDV